ncbi:MAG: thioredoxin [Paludibacteraceae bacterium]|nr:thioredoxin [Paludibacteraceae bacterium]
MKRFIIVVFLCSVCLYGHTEVSYMTTWDFTRLVYDFHKSEEWINKNDKPVVVDFYTTWCGPCKRLAPVLEEMSEAYKGKVNFYKVDIEQERELAVKFNIRSIPTLFIVPTQGYPKVFIGAQPRDVMANTLDQLLKK